MNPASSIAESKKVDWTRLAVRDRRVRHHVILLVLVTCLAFVTGCANVGTTVGEVWRDSGRADAPLGKTLVMVLAPQTEVVTRLENEWGRQLQGKCQWRRWGSDRDSFECLSVKDLRAERAWGACPWKRYRNVRSSDSPITENQGHGKSCARSRLVLTKFGVC